VRVYIVIEGKGKRWKFFVGGRVPRGYVVRELRMRDWHLPIWAVQGAATSFREWGLGRPGPRKQG
jgi:hypothetical protein